MSMLPVLVGVLVGMQFKLTQIQTASVGLATVIGSGVVSKTADGIFTIGGIGVVINAGITAALAVLFVRLIGDGLKEYAILLIPMLTVAIPGMIGFIILPYVQEAASLVGNGVAFLTNLQPVLMGALIAVAFGIIILSPISTVGIATVIKLSAGYFDLGCVHYDYIIAAVCMRCVYRFLLSAKDACNLCAKTSERTSVSVDNIPFSLDSCRTCHKCLHVFFS